MIDEVTNLLINMYEIEKIGIDFMGYTFEKKSDLSYHHYLLPKKKGGKKTVENGIILVRPTAHDYIHLIQRIDKRFYDKITKEFIDEKKSGSINYLNVYNINNLLCEFEEKYADESNKDGSLAIKDEFKVRLLKP